MKTKTIITALFMLFSIASFAQTKEQTIAWIKEKLEKHGGNKKYSYINVKVSPCHISFTEKTSSGSGFLISFNPSLAKSWKVSDDKTEILADAAIFCYFYKDDTSGGCYYGLNIRNGESDIHERMIKALLHLATFCEEGENEAF